MFLQKKGLKFQFVFFVTSLIIFTSCLSLITSVTRERSILIQNIIESALSNIELLSLSISTESSEDPFKKTAAVSDILLKNDHIHCISIYSAENTCIQKYCKPSFSDNFTINSYDELSASFFSMKDFFSITRPVEKNGYQIQMILSLQLVKQKIQNIVFENSIQTFVIASFGFFIAVFLSQIVIHPIDKLIKGVRTIASGEYDHRISMNAEKEIALLAAEINTMAENLEKTIESAKFIALGKLSASIAHEIRTPLVSIKSLIELMKDAPDMEKYHQDITIILNEVHRLNNFVDQLLNYSKPSKNKKKTLNINNSISEILMLLDHTIQKSDIKINTDYRDIPLITVDEEKIKQIFMNIIINAVQAIDSHGQIDISTYNDKNTVNVRITDNGPGISENIRKAIFDPFTTTKPGGTGLGLSIAIKLAHMQNADVKIEKTSTHGTTFLVTFNI